VEQSQNVSAELFIVVNFLVGELFVDRISSVEWAICDCDLTEWPCKMQPLRSIICFTLCC